jgi:cyclopropane-fatty-acyl-phospholipid synthase
MSRSLLESTSRTSAPRITTRPGSAGGSCATETATHPAQHGIVSRLELQLLKRVLHAAGNPPLVLELWDGRTLASSQQNELARISIHDRLTLWKLAIDPWFQFAEAYAEGRLDVYGELSELLAFVFRWQDQHDPLLVERLIGWCRSPRRNTLARSRDNVHHHYDLGNDFYQLWLDERLVYTCAYFPNPSSTLEQAQVAKMQHVCRKLRLREGERVVEAGCGWGALALFMAKHFGVSVTAFNISREQVAYARQRAREEGLAHRVEFVQEDWRNIRQACDAFVSIGMLEHVGLANYQELGKVIDRCLLPHGRGLLHTIGQNQPQPLNPWIERRIFPGAYPPTLRQIMAVLEPHDFAVLDVENLRLHYAETLRNWHERFERSIDVVRARFDERFVRMWRLYLCGSMAGFASGALQLFQVLFARVANNAIPWTRADIYAPAHLDAAGGRWGGIPVPEGPLHGNV